MFENTIGGEIDEFIPEGMEWRFSVVHWGIGAYVVDEWTGEDSGPLDMIDDARSFIEEQIALHPAREVEAGDG